MSQLSLLKQRIPEPPTEVIQAVCDLYGISRERIASIQAEKLGGPSTSLWVITLNERSSAIVVPGYALESRKHVN